MFNYLQTDSIPEVKVQITAGTGEEVQWDSLFVALCVRGDAETVHRAKYLTAYV